MPAYSPHSSSVSASRKEFYLRRIAMLLVGIQVSYPTIAYWVGVHRWINLCRRVHYHRNMIACVWIGPPESIKHVDPPRYHPT
ncbi:hypothetical protein CC77DRAFT_556752 [Alternaria alternata]|uniref:Uncharacterized protein n=1 Tax=Alternaria alternata TaxID=5599 RepID=A0A177D530_ALTAL|nr:hypothetical protein CC77DRAFT_556752 [Alternaria alternata]OAG14764.1 hypothetical protein CC77DRAFT_556752 [Alternaria alternata]